MCPQNSYVEASELRRDADSGKYGSSLVKLTQDKSQQTKVVLTRKQKIPTYS